MKCSLIIKMIDFRVVERNVINEFKPMLVNNFLMINELNLIPKEVTWLIIENLYHLQNDVQNLYHGKNLINFTDLYCLSLIAIQNKDFIDYTDYGLSDEINDLLKQFIIDIFKSFGANSSVPNLELNLQVIIPDQCYDFMYDKHKEYENIKIPISLLEITLN